MNEIINLGITNKDGLLVVSSRIIADGLGKEHKNVLRDLDNIINEGGSNLSIPTLFINNEYTHKQNGQKYREYLLTEDGFTLYMFNIQGYNDFKLKYIKEFRRMKEQLQHKMPKTFGEALLLAGKLQAEKERLELENTMQRQQITELKPKADYANLVLNSPTLVTVTQVAKDFGLSARKLNELLHEQKIQYKQGKQWFLYQKYAEMGLTQSSTYVDETGETRMSTKWTQRGRLFIYGLLKEKYNILPIVELGDDDNE